MKLWAQKPAIQWLWCYFAKNFTCPESVYSLTSGNDYGILINKSSLYSKSAKTEHEELKMPYCYVCKQFTDYEYDIALSNGDFLHTSCLIKLQIREDEIESVLRKQNQQLILSLFVQTEVTDEEVVSEDEIKTLSSELQKLKGILFTIYDFLPSWPPDWNERRQYLIQRNGSICSYCEKEQHVYLIHEIPLCEEGTNELQNLELICKTCHENTYGKGDIFSSFTLDPDQSEFTEYFKEIQDAIDNNQRIRFAYKKPKAKSCMTRVVIPERFLNIPNNRESGKTLCVEGFCELRQDIRVFALERMQEVEVLDY